MEFTALNKIIILNIDIRTRANISLLVKINEKKENVCNDFPFHWNSIKYNFLRSFLVKRCLTHSHVIINHTVDVDI